MTRSAGPPKLQQGSRYDARPMRRWKAPYPWSAIAALALLGSCGLPPLPPLTDADVDQPPRPDAIVVDAGIDAIDPDAPPGSAELTTEQGSHDFGDEALGESSESLTVFVSNSGDGPSGTLTVSLEGHTGDFDIVVATADDCDGQALDAGDSCVAQVQFAPGTPGDRAATLIIGGTPGGEVRVDLTGRGLTAGDLEIAAGETLTFGTIEIGSASPSTQSVTVRNTGGTATAPLTVNLPDQIDYTAVSDGCDGVPLASLASCTVEIRFNPQTVGSHPTQISIRESDVVGVAASASGTGSARLQVSKTGVGTISSDPPGIACGAGCPSATSSFTESPITLHALDGAGYIFDGWTGACATANPSPDCTVSLTQPLTTTGATFTQVFTLNMTVTGMGTVTSSPSGILCGDGNTDCSEAYETGTPTTLTVEPSSGWEVYAWSGTGAGCTTGQHICTVTMSQARNVTVELRRQYTVTVVPTVGTGTGTVTGGGISCPGTCTAVHFDGDAFLLTEAPGSAGAGSQNVFTTWGGSCSGSSSTCNVTVDGDETVTAQFTLQHQLSVTIAGTGSGSVSGTGGFTCASGTCAKYYDTGTTVTLTPTPGASSSFDTFSGDCSGATCVPTITSPRTITASFRAWDCVPDSIVCDDATDHYTDCSATGTIELEMDCPLGCATGAEKCLDVNPSNGLAPYLDVASSADPDVFPVSFTGTSTINTDTGGVTNNGLGIAPETTTFGGMRVIVFETLSIAGTLTVSGTMPLAIVVDGNVSITGTLDVSANGAAGGPGRLTAGACLGSAGTSGGGGGGGGRYVNGGTGGDDDDGSSGAGGGSALADLDIVPLQGGCKGGNTGTPPTNGATGGGGGGAIQIVSRSSISITGSGVIDASGGGGVHNDASSALAAGSGGGSGGGILLEAPQVIVDGSSVILSTKGGGGAAASSAAGTGGSGTDGGIGAGVAAGGTFSGQPSGGAGGNESSNPGLGGDATTAGQDGAGGGGSVGLLRFNTTSGTVTPLNGAAIRSRSSSAVIATRQVP